MQTDRIPEDDRRAVVRRLRRAEGQLRALSRTLEEGGDCVQVVQQLTAARNAVGSAAVKLLSAGLVTCLAEQADGDLVPEDFEKLFLQLT